MARCDEQPVAGQTPPDPATAAAIDTPQGDSAAWWESWTQHPERFQWKQAHLCFGEMNDLQPFFETGHVWVSVKRVFRDATGKACPEGRCCRHRCCPLRHPRDDDDLDTTTDDRNAAWRKVAMDQDNFTYAKLEFGPLILSALHAASDGMRGSEVGSGVWLSSESLHVSLLYGPIMSTAEVDQLQRDMNDVVSLYWNTSPLDRPDKFAYDRKFYRKDSYSESLDSKASVKELPWSAVESQHAAGKLFLNSRERPSEDDLEQLRKTWCNAHSKHLANLGRALAIDEDASRVAPPHAQWRLVHAWASDISAENNMLIFHGLQESDIFDLAEYLCSYLVQVKQTHRCRSWNRKVHKVQRPEALHFSFRGRVYFMRKPDDLPMNAIKMVWN
jgi:hypothetical protein